MNNVEDNNDPVAMLATLEITKTTPRHIGGTWVEGNIADHAFEALVFKGHATCADYELGTSRISKFFLQEHFTHTMVACFDRGWDTEPTTAKAKIIVDLLAAGLAEQTFGH